MAEDLNQTARKAVDYAGSPGGGGGGGGGGDWWEKVKRWVTNYLKPLVPASELARNVAQVINIIKSWFSGT